PAEALFGNAEATRVTGWPAKLATTAAPCGSAQRFAPFAMGESPRTSQISVGAGVSAGEAVGLVDGGGGGGAGGGGSGELGGSCGPGAAAAPPVRTGAGAGDGSGCAIFSCDPPHAAESAIAATSPAARCALPGRRPVLRW